MNLMNNMTIDPDVQLPLVEKMLYDLAWRTANTYPVPFEEAKAEAYYAFVRACHDYNPTKAKGSKFSSWCYFWVWTHLKTFVTKRSTDPLLFVEPAELKDGEAPSAWSPTLELVDELSEDAREIISLLLETPSDLLGGRSVTARQLLALVKKHLVEAGRSKVRVEKAHIEIETKFRAAWAN
jgi:hypothetical protein